MSEPKVIIDPDHWRFLLDEELSPAVARVARRLGVDVVSVHECGRVGPSDEQQLDLAAADGRVMVTRNRDDFMRLTRVFMTAQRPHAGVLIVSRSIPGTRPEPLGYALLH